MPIYVCLMKLTDQGIREIKNAPKRIQEAIKTLEAMGGKLIAFYMVMGEYDYVGIAEAPSDEVAATFLLGLGSSGHVRTTTLKALTMEQIAAIVERLP
ncbi:GYD domain-containing protein [Candidatus Bathyarchaeota archaeon]|nr:GYD domain-containing protein [Candidatus Bathyarchaeota archaeon]